MPNRPKILDLEKQLGFKWERGLSQKAAQECSNNYVSWMWQDMDNLRQEFSTLTGRQLEKSKVFQRECENLFSEYALKIWPLQDIDARDWLVDADENDWNGLYPKNLVYLNRDDRDKLLQLFCDWLLAKCISYRNYHTSKQHEMRNDASPSPSEEGSESESQSEDEISVSSKCTDAVPYANHHAEASKEPQMESMQQNTAVVQPISCDFTTPAPTTTMVATQDNRHPASVENGEDGDNSKSPNTVRNDQTEASTPTMSRSEPISQNQNYPQPSSARIRANETTQSVPTSAIHTGNETFIAQKRPRASDGDQERIPKTAKRDVSRDRVYTSQSQPKRLVTLKLTPAKLMSVTPVGLRQAQNQAGCMDIGPSQRDGATTHNTDNLAAKLTNGGIDAHNSSARKTFDPTTSGAVHGNARNPSILLSAIDQTPPTTQEKVSDSYEPKCILGMNCTSSKVTSSGTHRHTCALPSKSISNAANVSTKSPAQAYSDSHDQLEQRDDPKMGLTSDLLGEMVKQDISARGSIPELTGIEGSLCNQSRNYDSQEVEKRSGHIATSFDVSTKVLTIPTFKNKMAIHLPHLTTVLSKQATPQALLSKGTLTSNADFSSEHRRTTFDCTSRGSCTSCTPRKPECGSGSALDCSEGDHITTVAPSKAEAKLSFQLRVPESKALQFLKVDFDTPVANLLEKIQLRMNQRLDDKTIKCIHVRLSDENDGDVYRIEKDDADTWEAFLDMTREGEGDKIKVLADVEV